MQGVWWGRKYLGTLRLHRKSLANAALRSSNKIRCSRAANLLEHRPRPVSNNFAHFRSSTTNSTFLSATPAPCLRIMKQATPLCPRMSPFKPFHTHNQRRRLPITRASQQEERSHPSKIPVFEHATVPCDPNQDLNYW